MNRNLKTALVLFLAATSFTACKKDKQTDSRPQDEHHEEKKFVRLLVADAATNAMTFINPSTGELDKSFTSDFPVSTLYATGSKRYAAVLNGTNNHVKFFDSGIESHGDHAHNGTAKWSGVVLNTAGTTPAHFYVTANKIAIFNDGKGTISALQEGSLSTSGYTGTVIPAGNAHHGAIVIFDNGNYAVSVAGTDKTRTGVKIINASGETVHAAPASPVLSVHGNAGDGTNALFGSALGILLVKNTGEQEIIPYPSVIPSTSSGYLSSLQYGKSVKKFIGFRTSGTEHRGVYVINPVNKTITTILTDLKIRTVTFDAAGKDILVILEDGTVRLYDGESLAKKQETKLNLVYGEGALIPNITATENFVYVTNPQGGEVIQLEKDDFNHQHKIAIGGSPTKIVMIGADVDDEGAH